jgi:hypothetical protein
MSAGQVFTFMNYMYVVSPNIDVTSEDSLSIGGEDVLPLVFTRKIYVERFREILSLAFSNKIEQMMCKIAELKTSFEEESIEAEELVVYIAKVLRERSYGERIMWTNIDRFEMLEVIFDLTVANRFLNDLAKYAKNREEICKAAEETLLEKTRLPEDAIRYEILSYM